MAEIKNLYETIGEKAYKLRLTYPEIPKYISENLKYTFFDWQKDGFENFLTYNAIKERKNPNTHTHLMFNMATGTGKTLLMAAAILYYYKQGYRNFIFFVNQNNIVDKTENNFIDNTHNKYLFKDKIVIDDKTVEIKKVENFSCCPDYIEIKFITIQKLYNDIHIEKENRVILQELNRKNIVMLADEAHHFNADTKTSRADTKTSNKKYEQANFYSMDEITGRTSIEEKEKKGWEHTVLNLILKKNGEDKNNKNVLLEFTATIPTEKEVKEKYSDKIIYKFGLKDFISAGYTKEINLISSNFDKKERILQALLFHWYRHKIALKNDIANFKPVVLFRSKTIEESKADYQEFLNMISGLTADDFNFFKDIKERIFENRSLFEMGRSRTEQVLEFINKEKISYSEIADFLQYCFKEKNCIITNSKTNKTNKENTDEEQEKLLNNLEDKNNHIRAIFTVDRLTEGWDVLNLFDIVRLYQGSNTGGNTKETPEATTKEKQLIGRGVRYFPFFYKDKERNKRKFDEDLKNELRVLEELYYYTFDEASRYISHLKDELRKDGYISDDKIIKTFHLKKEFEESGFYQETKVWYNEQVDNPDRRKRSFADIEKSFFPVYQLKRLEMNEQEVDLHNAANFNDEEKLNLNNKRYHTIYKKVKDFEKHVFYKALNIKAKADNSLLQFDNLKDELEIESIEDLLKDEFLGDFEIKIAAPVNQDFENIDNREKLDILLKFFDMFAVRLKEELNPKIGAEFKAGEFEQFFGKETQKSVLKDNESDEIEKYLQNEGWYVLDGFHGTSEEKGLIEYLKTTIGNLEKIYKEVYLLRNEEVYKIYDFKKGRGFKPDFILFLKDEKKRSLYYQIFIEPKGDALLEHDRWKGDFLKEISDRYEKDVLKFSGRGYCLIGLPLFNKKDTKAFEAEYNKLISR